MCFICNINRRENVPITAWLESRTIEKKDAMILPKCPSLYDGRLRIALNQYENDKANWSVMVDILCCTSSNLSNHLASLTCLYNITWLYLNYDQPKY